MFAILYIPVATYVIEPFAWYVSVFISVTRSAITPMSEPVPFMPTRFTVEAHL